MIVVGLTGGIVSGKSTVSRLLARRGAVIIDADAIVHELQRPGTPLLEQLAARFGGDIISDTGHGVGWEAGGGLTIPVGNRLMLTPGVRYRALARDLELGGITTPVDLQYVTVALGLAYRF